MQIVINISEEIYEEIKTTKSIYRTGAKVLCNAIVNGTPLPKGHGRLIDEEQIPGDGGWDFSDRLMLTPTIIEADKESEDVNGSKKETIEILKDLWRYEHSEYPEKDIRKTLDIAIKALEQEPVLEKIRAEIDRARFIDKDTRHCRNALASGLEVALQIIDKYKAEREE